MYDLVIRGARRWGAPTADIAIGNGRIAAIGTDLVAAQGTNVIDASGRLVLPGLVDAHAHLDKTLWGTPWHPHQAGPSLMDKITNEREVLGRLGLSPELQSARLLRHMIARGTTHVRTHVDVGPEVGLTQLHGVQAMRERHRDWIDLEIVAFPQTGVMIRPGTLELLEQAAREGAEVIGGLDPIGVDRDPKGQLDGIFAIADRHGCGIDIHLHDRGDLGAVTIEMIAERTRSLGLAGKVAISHAFCLGMLEPARLDGLITLLLDNDISIMTHAPSGPTPFPRPGHRARLGHGDLWRCAGDGRGGLRPGGRLGRRFGARASRDGRRGRGLSSDPAAGAQAGSRRRTRWRVTAARGRVTRGTRRRATLATAAAPLDAGAHRCAGSPPRLASPTCRPPHRRAARRRRDGAGVAPLNGGTARVAQCPTWAISGISACPMRCIWAGVVSSWMTAANRGSCTPLTMYCHR